MTPTSSSSTLTSSASLRQQHQNQHRNAAAQQRVINDGALREKQKKKYGNNFQHPAAAESSIKPAAKKQRNTEHLAHSDGVLVAGNLRKHQRMLMESSCAEADNGDHADCDEDDEEKEPEGYRELYRSLETEVFGQHSMVRFLPFNQRNRIVSRSAYDSYVRQPSSTLPSPSSLFAT